MINLKIDHVSEVLQERECRRDLENLHKHFVIAPIDKATGNISLICKRFYAKILVNELGLKGEKSATYQSIRKKDQTIIGTPNKDLKSKFGIETSNVNDRLPNIYWLLKLHKKPIKFHFIIAAPECSVKPFV